MSFVCLLEIHLHFPENGSLKGKRRELSSLKAQLQRRFGAAVAETDHQDLWQRSELSVALVGNGITDLSNRAAALERYVNSMFPDGVRVPQFGWNAVEAAPDCNLLESGFAYFANSYRATLAPGWKVATAEHGGSFIAAIERGNVVGCQFHPELSGAYGAALLSRWLAL